MFLFPLSSLYLDTNNSASSIFLLFIFSIEVYNGKKWKEVYFQDTSSPKNTGMNEVVLLEVSDFLNDDFHRLLTGTTQIIISQFFRYFFNAGINFIFHFIRRSESFERKVYLTTGQDSGGKKYSNWVYHVMKIIYYLQSTAIMLF